ncbi:hypothetical protein D3C71_221400 [compost metagenome]
MQNNDGGEVRKLPLRTHLKRGFESLMVLSGLAGGGAFVGFYAAQQLERTNHLAEITRLQASHKVAIDAVLGQAQMCVATARQATGSAVEATAAVNEAADKAAEAASKADKAAKKAAVVASKATPPPAASVQPEVVNREIRKANEKLREQGR